MSKTMVFLVTLFLVFCYKTSSIQAANLPNYTWHTFLEEDPDGGQVLVSTKDKLGNIILAGISVNAFLGENSASPVTPFLNTLSPTVFVMKLNPQGQYLWHTFLGKSSTVNGEHILDLAVDSQSNIVIGGSSSRLTWLGPFSAAPKQANHGGNFDGFVLKINGNGEYLWHSFYGSTGADLIGDIAVDSADNIYALGSSNNPLWQIENSTAPLHAPGVAPSNIGLNTTSPGSAFIIKLDKNGQYDWHTFYGPDSRGIEFGALEIVKENATEYLYIAGKSFLSWAGDNGQPALNPISNKTALVSDLFLLKLKQNGDYQWHTFQGSGVNREDLKIAVSPFNEVYIAGTAFQPWLGEGSAQPLQAFQGGREIFISSFTREGEYRWHTFYGSQQNETINGIDLASNNHLYLTGFADGDWQNSISQTPVFPYVEARQNGVMFSVDKSGKLQWHGFLGGNSTTILGIPGSIFVAGNGANTSISKFAELNLIGEATPTALHGEEGMFLTKFFDTGGQPVFNQNTLSLPEVRVENTIYTASLVLVSGLDTLTVELVSASIVRVATEKVAAIFNNNILTIDSLIVDENLYKVELSLVTGSDPLRFRLKSAVKQ